MLDVLDRVVLSEDSINSILEKMAISISEDYKGLNLTILPIMNGSLFMAADLIRMINVPCQIECLKAKSYFGREQMSESHLVYEELLSQLNDRDVLILDEIYDTGNTIDIVLKELKAMPNITSVRSAVLLNKNKTKQTTYNPDYIGIEVDDEFLVGYGLDYHGMYRDLPVIGTLKSENF
jgi:hypoxanthine phosphoribosyltransferase